MSVIETIQRARGNSESAVYHPFLKSGLMLKVGNEISSTFSFEVKDGNGKMMPARLIPKLHSFVTGGHLVLGSEFRVHNFHTKKFDDVLHIILEKIEMEHLTLTSLSKLVSDVDEFTGECALQPPYKLQLVVSGAMTSVSDGKYTVPASISGVDKDKAKSNDTLVIDQPIIIQTDPPNLSKLCIQSPRIEPPVPWTVNNPSFATIEKLQQYVATSLERKRARRTSESRTLLASPSTISISNMSSLTMPTMLGSPVFSSLPLPPNSNDHKEVLLHKALHILAEVNHSHPALLQMFNLDPLPPSPHQMDPLTAIRERLDNYVLPMTRSDDRK
ncbi:hypothetical protein TrRE_jg10208 [Triparma retinervis]|uniref:Uncharacterized protein n=1 Tax=Triparma retinervis TaxID=2557542 RepID=A0A9W6ZZZ9_9STRA|nr:hypothetical protein TrRE_jg10208 [Triparma retinervis]